MSMPSIVITREERVLEHVRADDPPLRCALGPRRRDVVVVERLETLARIIRTYSAANSIPKVIQGRNRW